MATKIKRGDRVVVLSGKDKGKEGQVLSIDHKNQKAIVQGVNKIKKHSKANQNNPQGGIVEKEAPLHISKIAYLLNGKATRIGFKFDSNNKKQRFAKSTGEVI